MFMKTAEDAFQGTTMGIGRGMDYWDWLNNPGCPAIPPLPQITRDPMKYYEVMQLPAQKAMRERFPYEIEENNRTMSS
jgi:hypothetical protein